MNSKDINIKLAEINIEDFIWMIYLLIIIMSYYSNHLERNYYLTNNIISKDKYRKVLITIFSILIVVYVYFLKNSVDDLNNLRPGDSEKKKRLVTLSFLASLFISISGFIYLYIAVVDDDLNVELTFN